MAPRSQAGGGSPQARQRMGAYIVFTGNGPILILTTYPRVDDPRLVEKLAHKGVAKFIAYQVPLELVQASYGVPFEVIAADLAAKEDMRVLDFNGHHIFSSFSLNELGEPIRVGG